MGYNLPPGCQDPSDLDYHDRVNGRYDELMSEGPDETDQRFYDRFYTNPKPTPRSVLTLEDEDIDSEGHTVGPIIGCLACQSTGPIKFGGTNTYEIYSWSCQVCGIDILWEDARS